MNRTVERIQSPFIRIPFRDDQGDIRLFDVWREDHLDPGDGDHVYLVLDFGEEFRMPRSAPAGMAPQPTGRIILTLQMVHRDTGEGLSLPHERQVDPNIPDRPTPIEELGQIVAHEWSTKPLTGLTLIERSPRRATRD